LPDAQDEKKLVKASQKGDREALEGLIRLYYPYVSKFLIKTTGDAGLAEDLTQETFLKMIRGIDRFDPGAGAGFGTWVIAIAHNCFVDHLRKNRFETTELAEEILHDPQDMSDAVLTRLQVRELQEALAKLPEEQGLAIRLKYEEAMTLAEIGEHFGVPAKTVKSRIHEGTVKLRKMLLHQERKEKK
jgi:RNA polymerase sigma-70 factor (ECF subfamily)